MQLFVAFSRGLERPDQSARELSEISFFSLKPLHYFILPPGIKHLNNHDNVPYNNVLYNIVSRVEHTRFVFLLFFM